MQLKIEYLEITASQTKGVEGFLVQEKSDVKTHSGITPESAKAQHSWYFDKMQMNKMQQQKSSFHLKIKAHQMFFFFNFCIQTVFIYLSVAGNLQKECIMHSESYAKLFITCNTQDLYFSLNLFYNFSTFCTKVTAVTFF